MGVYFKQNLLKTPWKKDNRPFYPLVGCPPIEIQTHMLNMFGVLTATVAGGFDFEASKDEFSS